MAMNGELMPRGGGRSGGGELTSGGQVPPQDLDAERSLLGAALLQSDVLDDVLLHVRVEDFYADQHRMVFDVLRSMYDKGSSGIDVITVGRELESRGELKDVGGPAFLARLVESVPFTHHAVHYAKIVRAKAVQRRLIEACTSTLSEAYEGLGESDDMVAMAEKRIYSIAEEDNNLSQLSIDAILHETFDKIFERMNQDGQVSGTKTGFYDLDAMTSGFHSSELLVLAARPAMGKTAFVCNLALAIAANAREDAQEKVESGAKDVKPDGVLIFSLEQGGTELAERLLSIHARLSGHKLRQGTLDEVEQHSLMHASNELREMPIFIDDTAGRTMSQIAAISRRIKRRSGLGLVIVDYLQLVEPDDKNLPREQQIASTTRRMKFLAKDLSIPVITLSQLNRAVEQREDKRPRLADLRESGAIEQDADIVMFLHRPEAYDPEDRPGEAELIVAKNRAGPIGTVPLTWVRDQLRFADRAHVSTPDSF